MQTAHDLAMERGFSATTLDEVLTRAGASKGAFFHHFSSKADLGDALVRRYADDDMSTLERLDAQAGRLSDDPLQRLLLFVGLLLEEEAETGDGEAPGCLFAAFLYERALVSPDSRRAIAESMLAWRERVAGMVRAAAAAHPPRVPVDPETVADGLLAAVEGGFVLGRALDDPGLVARQLGLYRRSLEAIFS